MSAEPGYDVDIEACGVVDQPINIDQQGTFERPPVTSPFVLYASSLQKASDNIECCSFLSSTGERCSLFRHHLIKRYPI